MVLRIATAAMLEMFLILFVVRAPIKHVRKASRRILWGYAAAALLGVGGTIIILAAVLLSEARVATMGAGTAAVVAGCAVWAYGAHLGSRAANH